MEKSLLMQDDIKPKSSSFSNDYLVYHLTGTLIAGGYSHILTANIAMGTQKTGSWSGTKMLLLKLSSFHNQIESGTTAVLYNYSSYRDGTILI